MPKKIVSVIGPSRPDRETRLRAEKAGAEIARAGFILATGGLKGCMSAASRGAKRNHGTVIGVLPWSEPNKANPYVDIVLATGLGYIRNMMLVNISAGVVCVGMSPGTLTEASWAIRQAKPILGFMPEHPGLDMEFSLDETRLKEFLRDISELQWA